jgi:lipopolysaccharide/colanic/teichoic acid biosynthesis glycosyltransferase
MALDIRYIEQWSVWLDIKILFRTIPAVFRGSGAL